MYPPLRGCSSGGRREIQQQMWGVSGGWCGAIREFLLIKGGYICPHCFDTSR